jgi:hypothetical protein
MDKEEALKVAFEEGFEKEAVSAKALRKAIVGGVGDRINAPASVINRFKRRIDEDPLLSGVGKARPGKENLKKQIDALQDEGMFKVPNMPDDAHAIGATPSRLDEQDYADALNEALKTDTNPLKIQSILQEASSL